MSCDSEAGRRRRLVASACFVCLLLSALAAGQVIPAGDPFNAMGATTNMTASFDSRGGGTNLLVTVYEENNKIRLDRPAEGKKARLDRQAVVKLTNRNTQTVSWLTTTDRSEAAFGDLQFGHYDIEVSAVGYLTEHKELNVISALNTVPLDVILQRDPAAVDFTIADAALPQKARKDTKHGVSALKSGNLNEAQKRLDAAYRIAPSSSDLNFLLGYLFYQRKDFGRAATFLGTATSLSPNNAQALTLLGRLGLQQEDYKGAAATLEKAVAADSESWQAHSYLADAYLRTQRYEKARDQAQLALDKGKNGASPAQLVLGQALVNLGQRQEGIQALQNFLQTSPKNPVAPQVRNLIAELNAPQPIAATAPAGTAVAVLRVPAVDPLMASFEPTFSVKPWQPPGIDESKPAFAAGVTCPYENVIQMSGLRVKQLVDDVARIAAIEHLLHEQLDEMGNPMTKDTRDFNYVVSISEAKPGFLGVDEYRAEHLGLANFPDQIASSGFAALALVFHPSMRDNFEMTCEGLGDWHGQSAWVVHFKQRDDRPARIHDYKVGAETYSVKLKGRAWITTDKFQIVRIESELVSPMPEIRLYSEHQVVEYGPIPFGKKNEELWLPKSAEIYFDFRKHRYYRRHSFDHYMLFSVDSDEKRKEPKAPPADPTAAPPA